MRLFFITGQNAASKVSLKLMSHDLSLLKLFKSIEKNIEKI